MDQAREAAQVVTEFFQGNPFGTQVGRMIEQATDDTLPSENWALNMDICDAINSLPDGPRDAVRAIRKRLQLFMGKNNTIVLYTLTVLETCVKNCDCRFVQLVAQREFCQDLIKLIGSKYDPPQVVQEKVLGLIQAWSDAFRGRAEYKGVCDVYDELKAKGVDFPMTDVDAMVPIITPRKVLNEKPIISAAARISSEQPFQAARSPNVAPILLNGDQLSKLRADLDIVNGNIKVLMEMLCELHPGKEDKDDLQLLRDLHKTCKQMQHRLVALLQRVANEEVTSELLMINDEMNNVFAKYDRYEQNRCNTTNAGLGDPGQSTAAAGTVTGTGDKSLIDFNGDKHDSTLGVAAQQKGGDPVAVTTKPNQPATNIDTRDFDQFAAKATNSDREKEEKKDEMFAL